ncbi:transposase [Marinitoga litoralis]|uniref:transposase n=1 Tax=Marinitoga litoralis TaxID=570855 RepID=UPI00196173CE|nr:transposase [Marinitoga litoralis]MBM7560254.1 transposase [Marinitoga litoralis]
MMHNPKQFYLDFVYEEYMKSHSSFSYILTLFEFINWSIIPSVKNPGVGRTGYSPVSMIKALLFKIIKGLPSIPALIDELYSNPYLAQAIGFDPIKDYVPSESTFSLFRKSFDVNIIYSLITDLLFRGISAGFISTEFLAVDSFPESCCASCMILVFLFIILLFLRSKMLWVILNLLVPRLLPIKVMILLKFMIVSI